MKQYKVGDIITSPVTGVKFKVVDVSDRDIVAETKGVKPKSNSCMFSVIIPNRLLNGWEMCKKKKVKPTEEEKEEEYYWLAENKERSINEDYYDALTEREERNMEDLTFWGGVDRS